MLEAVEICDFSGKLKSMPPPDCTAKVVMIGDSGVGKSKILSSYNGERFNPTYMQTRGDFRKKLRSNFRRAICNHGHLMFLFDRETNQKVKSASWTAICRTANMVIKEK